MVVDPVAVCAFYLTENKYLICCAAVTAHPFCRIRKKVP